MKTRIGAAVFTGVLAFASPATIDPAGAATLQTWAQMAGSSHATDVGVRRTYRRYGYRSYEPPHYYGRPDYYRPYPYPVPVPFFLGFAFSPFGL